MTDQPTPEEHLDVDAWVEAETRVKPRFFTASEDPRVVALRNQIVALAATIELVVPGGRNKSLALTHLEDLQMRANRGIFAPAEHR